MALDNSLAAERASITPDSPLWGEHRSRYHFAAPYVTGRRVLDIACGTGFGEKILLDAGAESVVAADYSEEALVTTKSQRTPGTCLLRTDGTRLPFDDKTFNCITSFETVEHISEYGAFVDELRRVLKDDGILVISTPNANYTRPVNGEPVNPYHVYEFTPSEFEELLLVHFRSIQLYGQRVAPEYRLCPFWELPDMLPDDPISKIKIAAWKVQSRLPFRAREWISQTFQHRQFFPGR